MGPSGCGKTTLLDALSGQRPIDSGSIKLNKERLSKKWRRKICYVLQQDIFFAELTLRETLEYTAMLRLPDKLPKSEKMRCVDHILEILDLTPCQHTKIGDYMSRGLSGGEKKRANIACELLTNPSIMLLDEPTSGLDSHAAASLISSLQRYALQENKTVVITVHQPSSQMFHMFDRLLLLCKGQTAYFGNVDRVVDSFQEIGLTMKDHYNPADFILEQIKSSSEVREKIIAHAREARKSPSYPAELNSENIFSNYGDLRRLSGLDNILSHAHAVGVTTEKQMIDEEKHLWIDTQSHTSSASSDSHDSDCGLGYPTGFYTQFKVLSQRNFKEARPRMLSPLNWFQTLGLGGMAGALWFQLPRTEESLHDIQGWMFFSQTYWMLFALFGALSSFPPEREVISKERRSGAYRLSAYYLAKMVGELPLVVTLPAVYHLISYPMLGFSSPSLFFTMLAFLLLNTIVAQSVGFFVGACCIDMNLSITVSALYTLATQLFGGYLSTRFPPWLEWVRYTSMIHYAYQNMQILEFSEGPPILCAEQSKFPICSEEHARVIPVDSILSEQGCNAPLWVNTLVLLGFLIVFRLLGYFVLRYVRCPK
ncbi:ABC transporter G family member 14 [Pseudolycoriella hygida]|uniref:ABC transporter G family member 14 n=1 Tax=Pseudolycoriella hygida TaxID=35572 RepID=A0A9Q0S9S6_9DIPT|nr:ABC transporter G family member 14 [Pseudolycoriella hygida]